MNVRPITPEIKFVVLTSDLKNHVKPQFPLIKYLPSKHLRDRHLAHCKGPRSFYRWLFNPAHLKSRCEYDA